MTPHVAATTAALPAEITVAIALVLVGVGATCVALTWQPDRQALTLSAFGLTLAVLFTALQAPDVALSQIGVETAIVPLMVMLALKKMARTEKGPGPHRRGRPAGDAGKRHP